MKNVEKKEKNIAVFGDKSVGKTLLIKQFLKEYDNTDPTPTVGEDYFEKELENGYTLNILDTAKFNKDLCDYQISSNKGFIIVYECNSESGFLQLYEILNQIWKISKSKNMPIIIFINKTDLYDKKIVDKEKRKIIHDILLKEFDKKEIKNNNIKVFAGSAKNNEKVNEIFYILFELMDKINKKPQKKKKFKIGINIKKLGKGISPINRKKVKSDIELFKKGV